MRVLIVRVGAMGDVLHALPAVAALRRERPDWIIDWVIDERWAPLLVDGDGHGPIVNRVFRVPIKAWKAAPFSATTVRSLLAFRKLRGKYDVVVDMQGTLRSAVIGRMAGGKLLVGYDDPRESLAAAFYGRKLKRAGTHVVEQGAALLGEACGIALTPGDVTLPVDALSESAAEQAVAKRPLCFLAPGGGWGAKQWLAENFGQVARRLTDIGFDVAINAKSADDPLAAQVIEASGGAARAVPSSVSELIALLRRTDLFIGGDSGPTHLAAALAVPLVALFGPTDPARNGPWGPGAKVVLRDSSSVTTYKRTPVTEPGLARISVDQVTQAVATLTANRQ